MAGDHCPPMPNSLPLKELLYSQQILISLQHKSQQSPFSRVGDGLETRLTPLARIAKRSLEYDFCERPSAHELLEDPFFH